MRFVVADLDEPRARAREHVGDAEAVADLDQLAARDEHLAALGERGEREQHGGGVVVDDERRLGAGQRAQERREVVLARAARARVEVVLEVRVAAADLDDAVERRLRERRAAEVRVDEHAGRVEHAPQRGPGGRGELGERGLDEVARIAARADLLARRSSAARAAASASGPRARPASRGSASRRSTRWEQRAERGQLCAEV